MCQLRCSNELSEKDATAWGVKWLVQRLQVLEDIVKVKQTLLQNLIRNTIYNNYLDNRYSDIFLLSHLGFMRKIQDGFRDRGNRLAGLMGGEVDG